MLIAHITFNIPYVILSVMPKLKQTNRFTYEAALDLGASPFRAFFKVVFPDILPGVLSGFLLAFTMSLDDFIITHFTRGAGINTHRDLRGCPGFTSHQQFCSEEKAGGLILPKSRFRGDDL